MWYTGIQHTHLLLVMLFLISIIVKTVLLFVDHDKFDAYRAKTKIPEMVVTILFLITGVIMIVAKEANFHFFLWVKIGVILAAIPVSIVAFKKKKKYLALIGAFLFVMVYGLAEMAGGKANANKVEIAEESAGSVQHGEKLYMENCVSCHGDDGAKQLGGASNLMSSTIDTVEVKSVIMNGRGSMAAYKESLNEQEIEALKTYVLTLRGE